VTKPVLQLLTISPRTCSSGLQLAMCIGRWSSVVTHLSVVIWLVVSHLPQCGQPQISTRRQWRARPTACMCSSSSVSWQQAFSVDRGWVVMHCHCCCCWPCCAASGEGIPDLLQLMVKLTQSMLGDRLTLLSETQATVRQHTHERTHVPRVSLCAALIRFDSVPHAVLRCTPWLGNVFISRQLAL
jgi:hypothetical protein